MPYCLPDLNQLLAASKRTPRDRHGRPLPALNHYATMKREHGVDVILVLRSQLVKHFGGIPRLPLPIRSILFLWVEKEKRRDPDNIAAGGTKIILDSLQQIGVIRGDGWALYEMELHREYAMAHKFLVDPQHAGVFITITYASAKPCRLVGTRS